MEKVAFETKYKGYETAGLRLSKGQTRTCNNAIGEGCGVFVSLPTGSVKSLCYWTLPYIFDFILRKHSSMIMV